MQTNLTRQTMMRNAITIMNRIWVVTGLIVSVLGWRGYVLCLGGLGGKILMDVIFWWWKLNSGWMNGC